MKLIVVAFAFVAIAVAAPVEEPIKILRSEREDNPDGSYIFNYETENGITRNEQGELKEALDEDNKPHTVVVVRGSYSYTDKDGNAESVNYFADETGFHADGPSIPKPVSRR